MPELVAGKSAGVLPSSPVGMVDSIVAQFWGQICVNKHGWEIRYKCGGLRGKESN